MSAYTTRDTCRICGCADLQPVYNFGKQYISNFVDPGQAYDSEPCPIELVSCPNCTLVQNPHTAPQELLYSGFYWYRSGVTATMREALADVVRDAMSQVDLQPMDVVLDIGSNDGTLLGFYPDDVVRVGVEPAKNLASEPQEKVDLLINDFWSEEAYTKHLGEDKATIITACGMFYDLDDPSPFISAVQMTLHPDGIFIAQLMCLKNMIACNDIGNMAHEHLEFYTLRSLDVLLSEHGLFIADITTNNVNGESYRLSIRHEIWEGQTEEAARRVLDAFAAEATIMDDLKAFIARMEANRDEVYDAVQDAVSDGKVVCVYGASTKGNFLLQWYGLDDELIRFAADKSPEKWAKVTAGTDIKIYAEAVVRQQRPDYFLVLPYAFLPEFIEREKDERWRVAGGKFIVPLPELRIV
jgi:cyclopropane fatty-acyl-phospholipid synthase-like methyltransferase